MGKPTVFPASGIYNPLCRCEWYISGEQWLLECLSGSTYTTLHSFHASSRDMSFEYLDGSEKVCFERDEKGLGKAAGTEKPSPFPRL